MKVYIKQPCNIFLRATFLDCILCQLGMKTSNLSSDIYYCHEQNKLKLSSEAVNQFTKCNLSHSNFCPMLKLSQTQITQIPEDVIERGVNVGVVVILECSNEKILITRRAAHMRTFPNAWVPPGGHVELDESLLNAGLRELKEETGLVIKPDAIKESSVLGMWESVFPFSLELGLPSRHHIVTYFHILLRKSLEEVANGVMLNKKEVDMAVWLSRNNVKEILNTDMTLAQEDMFMYYVDENGAQYERSISFEDTKSVLVNLYTKQRKITSGTKYALSQWLSRNENYIPNSNL